jgi:allantoinase
MYTSDEQYNPAASSIHDDVLFLETNVRTSPWLLFLHSSASTTLVMKRIRALSQQFVGARPSLGRTATTSSSATTASFGARTSSRRSLSAATTTTYWCGQTVLGDNGVTAGSIDVRKDTIVNCYPHETYRQAKQRVGGTVVDLGNEYCLVPGLVDVHTHISAVGRTWEGYETATQAAAAGGITTLMGMPLNSLPPTSSVAAMELERAAAAQADLCVDVGLWGGVLPPEPGGSDMNSSSLHALIESDFIFGIKAFLAPLPSSAGYAAVSPKALRQAAHVCGKAGLPMLVHAELMSQEEWEQHTESVYATNSDTDSYRTHVATRPAAWEQAAVRSVCQIVQDDVCDMHIVHLSDAGCLEMIRQTKEQVVARRHSSSSGGNHKRRRRLTVETCPHYLLFTEEEISNDNDTAVYYKCFPPIRSKANQKRLWQDGLHTGLIDMIASDHSPCEPDMRVASLRDAWGGLTGLQYQLPATWTAAQEQGASLTDLVRWWCTKPASLVPTLAKRKGRLAPGYQADFCWWDPSHEGQPSATSREYHRWKGDSVYAQQSLQGRVLGTWVAGQHVYDGWVDEHLTAPGTMLRRSSRS